MTSTQRAGSEEEAAQQADAAAAESKERLVHELQQQSPEASAPITTTDTDTHQGTNATGPVPDPSQTPRPPGQTPLATNTTSSGSRASTPTDGKPPLASSAPTVSNSDGKSGGEAGVKGESSKGTRHGGKGDTGQQGTAAVSAQARQSSEEEEELPPSMTFKVRVYLNQSGMFSSW